MPNFHYRALTQSGELVSGSIAAPTAAEVSRRIEYLGLVLIDTAADSGSAAVSQSPAALLSLSRPRPEDVTTLTRDLALLLRAGARIDDALELLASDIDIGRLRPMVAQIKASILAGESFAEAIARHPSLFPAMYVSLVRVGEASGTLDQVLELLADERDRAATVRRKLTEALRYPLFLLFAATCVMVFFLTFVLPQFSAVLRDFGAKLDPVVTVFLALSDFLRAHEQTLAAMTLLAVLLSWMVLRQEATRRALISSISRWPGIRRFFSFYRTGLFCRNLGLLLRSGVTLTETLRILADIMAATGSISAWTAAADRVRHGGKLSDALLAAEALPPMAVRMLRLGEETGQLPVLAGRVADFYEAKLQRGLDRIVGIAGPLAIIVISVVVGGLIVSVMTALLSVNQIVG
jgi:general secretion pathway protein F